MTLNTPIMAKEVAEDNKNTQRKKDRNPNQAKTGKKKCILTEHDWIVEAFHLKFKREEGKKWLLTEKDWFTVVAAVNQ